MQREVHPRSNPRNTEKRPQRYVSVQSVKFQQAISRPSEIFKEPPSSTANMQSLTPSSTPRVRGSSSPARSIPLIITFTSFQVEESALQDLSTKTSKWFLPPRRKKGFGKDESMPLTKLRNNAHVIVFQTFLKGWLSSYCSCLILESVKTWVRASHWGELRMWASTAFLFCGP